MSCTGACNQYQGRGRCPVSCSVFQNHWPMCLAVILLASAPIALIALIALTTTAR
jgi:hypothetical protein